MRQQRIFVVGSLNMDLVSGVERLPRAGETVAGGDLALFAGGKGANQACAASKLGGRVKMIGETGADAFGERLLDSLRKAGVDTAGVGVSARTTGTACISVLPSGENAIIISPGSNAALTPEAALERMAGLRAGDLVLLQLEIPMETVAAVLEQGARVGAVTMLDPAPARSLPAEVLRHAAYLTPNQTEAGMLLGDSALILDGERSVSEAAGRLLALGPRAVILKLGPAGCFMAADGIRRRIAGFPVEAVDTTAAGDTFNGAMAVGLAEGMPVAEAACFANAAAAISVTRRGAQNSIPYRDEVTAFLRASGHVVMQEARLCS